jgi:hypothetical protein
MNTLFTTGRIVDLILGLVLIEIIALTILRKLSKRGMRPFDLLASLLAGIGLLLALRGALTGRGWPVIALCLGSALIAHLWDLSRRWSAARTR